MSNALKVAIRDGGVSRDYLMLQAAGTYGWDTSKVLLSTDSFFTIEYMADTDPNQIGVTIAFDQTVNNGGQNGQAAFDAAVGAGGDFVFQLAGDPTSWVPPSADMAVDGTRGIGRLVVGGLRHRMDAVRNGGNSGDETTGSSVWVDARSITATQDASTSVVGFDADANAVTLGIDTEIEDTLVLGVSATRGEVSGDQANSPNGIDSHGSLISLYGNWHSGDLAIDAIGTVGHWTNSSLRYVGAERITGAYGSLQRGISAIGKLGFGSDTFQVAPQLGVQYQSYEIDGYQETGDGTPSSAALGVSQVRYDQGEVGVGLSLNKTITASSGTWIPAAEVMVWRDVVGDRTATQARFLAAGAGTPFVTTGAESDANRVAASFSIQYRTENNLSVELSADVDATGDYLGQGVAAKLEYRY